MARPKSDTVEYFSHDSHASEGRTLTIIEGEFGLIGYAFWYKLLEWLGRSEGHYYDASNPEDLEFLVRKLGVDVVTGTEILNKLAKLRAIDATLWEQRVIWASNFVERLSDVYKKRGRDLPQKPSSCNENPLADSQDGELSARKLRALRIRHSVSGPVMPQSKVKETKVKDSKDKGEVVDKSTTPQKPQGRLSNNPQIAQMQEHLGFPALTEKDPIPNPGKEAKFIAKAESRGFTWEEIFKCWMGKVKVKNNQFVSMQWVNEDIGKPARGNGSRSGRAADDPGKFEKQKFAHRFER